MSSALKACNPNPSSCSTHSLSRPSKSHLARIVLPHLSLLNSINLPPSLNHLNHPSPSQLKINLLPSFHSCSKAFSSGSQPVMWNLQSSSSHYQRQSHSGTSRSNPLSEPMLTASQPTADQLLPPHSSALNSSSVHSEPNPHLLSASHPCGLENPTVIRSLIKRFSPPFKPFGSTLVDSDDDSVGPSDSPIFLSPTHSSSNMICPQDDLVLLSARPSARRRDGLKKAPAGSFTNGRDCTRATHRAEEDADDDELKAVAFDSDVEMLGPATLKRPRRTADKHRQAASSSPSKLPRSTPRSILPSTSHSRSLAERDSEDQDSEGTITGFMSKQVNGHAPAGRAARARRALNGDPGINDAPWLGQETEVEPVASSSTAQIPSPRLRGTRRSSASSAHSPDRLGDSASPASSDDDSPVRPPREGGAEPIKPKPSKANNARGGPKAQRIKRPKLSTESCAGPESASQVDGTNEPTVKRRVATLMPATEPDESGQYESSTCHQCRVKTTRPKMICDQSQDPNCVVRVCHTCLMVRTVYDGMPELRPPLFEFVPGGTMLCVKCRDICPCASCRRRRGEKEQCRRGLGSGLKGFYGLTPEEREQALARKKEKQDAIRLKKEARPPSEKKAPAILRREVTSIRQAYDDDEHERLQHWAPLPVFPPLPKPRKKKRRRLEVLDGVRLDYKPSETDTDTSCSDSDSYDDSDSDSHSLSSGSSLHSNPRPHVVLGAASFQLPLSSTTRRTVPLLTKRWRSNGSRLRPDDGSGSFSSQLYQAVKGKKPKSDKAPVVWIKSGAMVQARKPPTTEFMQRLAEEQKGLSCESTVVGAEDGTAKAPQAGSRAVGMDIVRMDGSDPPAEERPSSPLVVTSPRGNAEGEVSFAGLATSEAGHVMAGPEQNEGQELGQVDMGDGEGRCSCTMEHMQPSMDRIGAPLGSHSASCPLLASSRDAKDGGLDEHGLAMFEPRGTPGASGGLTDVMTGEFGAEMAMGAFGERNGGLGGEDGFGSDGLPMDHQTYLAGLTDEELREVVETGGYVLAKRGFLVPPTTAQPEAGLKFDGSTFSTGISPELISASLPSGSEEAEMGNETEDQGGETVEMTEEDQEKRVIQAANWAAVWGITDGAGGFTLTGLDSELETGGNVNAWWESAAMTPEVTSKGKSGLRASVEDRWLTDAMTVDSC